MIAAPVPTDQGFATSPDGTRVAWYRYGGGPATVVFVPTWNLVDSRVVGNQVAALEGDATVITYDPRGAGRSDRPPRGYDFSAHAADGLAVMDATRVERAAVVTASRGLNAAVLMATTQPERVGRLAAVGPYMRLEAAPAPPDPARLEALRTDWRGFIDPFMHNVFTEPDSGELIEEMIGIGMEATPDVVVQQERELDWATPARLLREVTCPTLIIHGESDAAVPVSHAREIADAMPNARLHVVAGGGHRPDIRSPELVNPVLLDFLFAG